MPDITPVVRPFVIRGTGAARLLTDSLNAAHAAGLTVSTAPDLGVICTSTEAPKWEPAAFAPAVSVLGAVLLAKQPPIVDVDAALTHVFGTRPEFHEGVEDGVSGKDPPAPNTDQLRAEGWFLGVQMRTLVATVPCALHMTRYPRGAKCPDCAAGVPVERPAETTGRMQIDTPRSVIAELISSLTVAQVLEALADSIPGRGWSEDRTVDTVEDLRDLADEYRREEGP